MTVEATREDALEGVLEEVIAPAAGDVDAAGRFPREAIEALGSAGLLGLISAPDVGGHGAGLGEAAAVVERIARRCSSTAMVVMMHYAATAPIEAHGPASIRSEIAEGRHLTTLALSESGSRSHFWAPMSTATGAGHGARLDARKSWVTSAGEADSYVWSSRPRSADGTMTLWLVPDGADGLTQGPDFDGLGLRGNGSTPMTADAVEVPASAQLGDDGAGLDVALQVILPWFLILNASISLGMMEAVTAETNRHLACTRLEHQGRSLADESTVRADLARMRLTTDSTRALINDTVAAASAGRADAQLRVLEVKAAAAEAATEVIDRGMRLCGGAAFRKELGIERRFRDAMAARVMAPTTPALLDFIARAELGMPLLEETPA